MSLLVAWVFAALSLVGVASAGFVTVSPGWVLETVVSHTSLQTPEGLAWDNKGFLYIADVETSTVAKLPVSALPITDESSFVWKKAYSNVYDHAYGLLFKSGKLYLSQPGLSQIAEIDPANGNILRNISTTGIIAYPTDIEMDPLSGDVFVSDRVGGIHRVKNIGTTPDISLYGSAGGVDSFFFRPDGSLILVGSEYIWTTQGTNQPNPNVSVVTWAADFRSDGAFVTCQANTPSGFVNYLIMGSTGSGDVNLFPVSERNTRDPGTGPIAVYDSSPDMGLARVGPDGKLYVTMHNAFERETQVFRLSRPGVCVFNSDPSNSPANFPASEPGLCPAGNCPTAQVNNGCAATHASAAGKCVTLEFSPASSACPF